MVFDHKVKYNGVWYRAGEEITDGSTQSKSVESSVFDSNEDSESRPHTKTDINRMNVEALRELARKNNVPNCENMTGQELKTYLITLFEL